MFTITIANTYLVDSNHTKAASGENLFLEKTGCSLMNWEQKKKMFYSSVVLTSHKFIVVSVGSFTRNICAMIFSLTAVQIRGSLGDGWS
jgi:hypothetical protein